LLAWNRFGIFRLIQMLRFDLILNLVTSPERFFGCNDGIFKEYGDDGQ